MGGPSSGIYTPASLYPFRIGQPSVLPIDDRHLGIERGLNSQLQRDINRRVCQFSEPFSVGEEIGNAFIGARQSSAPFAE
ncbi:MAG: hypothetical protein D6723_03870 [Acidobacteria bacterium]|nr:MAG: hypothetical protein D6723_03870 [Acidobacteriota bacterium]